MCTGAEIAGIVGAAVSTAGAVQSSKAQSAAIERQAQIEQQRAKFEKERAAEEAQRLEGRQRALIGKSGATTTGSVLETMRGSAEQAELDALNIQFGADAGTQSRLFEAGQVRKAGNIGAASTLLTSASKIKSLQ